LKEQGDDERSARTLMRLGLTHHIAFDFRRARQAYDDGFALWRQAAEAGPTAALPLAPHALREAGGNPVTLDPAHAYDLFSGNYVEQLFCGLVELTPELSVVPGVAKSWEVTRGGRQYLFHLRDDAVWSDGVPLSAGDFVHAWERVLDPATGSRHASLLYVIRGAQAYHQGLVSGPGALGVRALDDITLLVELEAPTAYLLHLLANIVACPVPRHLLQKHGAAWTHPDNIVGNGPFTLVSWTPGKSMVLQRNVRYHGRFAGNVQEVELSIFSPPDRGRLLELYEADLLDIGSFETSSPKEIDHLRQRHAGEYMTQPSSGVTYLVFDVTRPPFDDPRLRRALAYAADRDALAHITLVSRPLVGSCPSECRAIEPASPCPTTRGAPSTSWQRLGTRAVGASPMLSCWRIIFTRRKLNT
jgi:ABC-type oligopeptide transport system substrate-binding subunit